MPEWIEGRAINEGEDIAGTIHELGPGVGTFTLSVPVDLWRWSVNTLILSRLDNVLQLCMITPRHMGVMPGTRLPGPIPLSRSQMMFLSRVCLRLSVKANRPRI